MQVIQGRPKTALSLSHDLEALGVERGMTLFVHSSLSSVGWVVGGAETVVRELVAAVGDNGTLAMPSATPHRADPATWSSPKVPDEWLDVVRETMPVFDPRTTPTSLGAIPETFRNWPGTLRSDHPVESVCARGVHAGEIVASHPLAFAEGLGSPWDKLHTRDAWIMLLGVGFDRCTALHFAESLSEKRRLKTHRFPVVRNGERVWQEVQNVADDKGTLFPLIGERYLSEHPVREGLVGDSPTLLFPMRSLIECALAYFDERV